MSLGCVRKERKFSPRHGLQCAKSWCSRRKEGKKYIAYTLPCNFCSASRRHCILGTCQTRSQGNKAREISLGCARAICERPMCVTLHHVMREALAREESETSASQEWPHNMSQITSCECIVGTIEQRSQQCKARNILLSDFF